MSTSTSSVTPHRVKVPFVSQKVEDLLLWRDPKKSGIAFGGATLVFLFFFFLKMPMISLVLYTVGTTLLLVTLWARFGKSVGRPLPELPPYLREGMSESDYRSYADRMKPHVDKALGWTNHIVLVRDLGLNIKLIVGLFVAGKVLAWMSPISIAYLVLFVAFVGPKVYETYKDHIDKGIEQARSHAVNTYDTASREFNKRVDQVPQLKQMRDRMQKKTE